MDIETTTPVRAPTAAAPEPGGDRLRALVLAHYDFVWRAVVRLGVPRAEAEDTAQQVFLLASRKLASIAPGSERSFLFQAARRLAANARRTIRRRREDGEVAVDLVDPGDGPEADLVRARSRELLDQALCGLPLDLREVFVLYELEELTMAEIAPLLDLPPGTVASRLRRARAAFRTEVSRLVPGGAP